jgi:hypothetical protein
MEEMFSLQSKTRLHSKDAIRPKTKTDFAGEDQQKFIPTDLANQQNGGDSVSACVCPHAPAGE